MKLVSEFDIRVGIIYGPHVKFVAGEPQEVEDLRLIERCKRFGCTEVNSRKVTAKKKDTPTVPLSQAMHMLIDAGDMDAFDVHGRPRLNNLKKIMGTKVTSEERDEAWEKLSPTPVVEISNGAGE